MVLIKVLGMIDIDARLDEILNHSILRSCEMEANPTDMRTYDNTVTQLKQLIAEVVKGKPGLMSYRALELMLVVSKKLL